MTGDSSFDGGDASSSDRDGNGVGSDSTISQKRKRGIVSMNKVTEARKSGIKIKVKFNDKNQAVGKNKSAFDDYIGVVARNHVPLTENDWRDVPETLKQRLWEDIEQCFDVSESNRKMVYKKLGKAARAFRANLSKCCYDSEGNPILTPPAEYAHLGVIRDSWEGFVEAVGSNRFKQMSQSNSVSAQNKKYLCRSGALGYAQLEEIIKEKLVNEPPAKHRMIMWRELRRKADGTLDEDVQKVYEEGEKIVATLNEEELLCRGSDDILAKVIGKEYHGRVLTAGFGVTKGDYFGVRRYTSNDAHVHQLTQLVMDMGSHMRTLESEVQDLKAQVHNQEEMAEPSFHESPIGQSGHGSCASQFPLIPEGESTCDIFVESPYFVMVGSGSVWRIEGQRMHSRLLNVDQVKVRFTNIVIGCEGIPLPYPNYEAEITLVSHALGTFVAWPLKLVSLQKQVTIENVSKDKSIAQSATPVKKATYVREGNDLPPLACFVICKSFVDHQAREYAYSLPLLELFWGVALEDKVSFEQVREIVRRDWLSASAICLYIRYLCDSYLYDEVLSTRFSFISPHRELEHAHLVDLLLKHQNQDHLVIIPYNLGHSHWVLIAINMMTEKIYYMDSLRIHHSHEGRAQFVEAINKVMISYRGVKQQSSVRKKLTRPVEWVSIECPRQDSSSGLCGFFICCFIEDILESNTIDLSLAYFQKHRCDQFPESRITSVQHGWCSFFYHKFLVE